MSQDMFPQAQEFTIRSNPVFLIQRGDEREILVFDASMLVRTNEPKVDRYKKRSVPIEVIEWVAKAESRLLGGEITFQLSEEKQRPSYVRAKKTGTDFPANLLFRMNYEVVTVLGKLEGFKGEAVGTINAFPPKASDMFSIEGKTLTIGDILVTPLVCAC